MCCYLVWKARGCIFRSEDKQLSIFTINSNQEKSMNKAIWILCLLLASLAFAQRQSVVVLPSLATPETKLTPKQKELLTEEVRTIAAKLPSAGFFLMKQDEVNEVLGDEAFVSACEEGTCVGQLVKQLQANFGARCDAYAVGGQLYLKFELYGTFKGQNEAQTIDQFNDPVKSFADMQAVIKKKVPAIFNMITKSPQDACVAGGNVWENGVCKTAEQIAMEFCQSEGKTWINGACKSRAQIACEATAGRKWVGEECVPSLPSSASQQSVASSNAIKSAVEDVTKEPSNPGVWDRLRWPVRIFAFTAAAYLGANAVYNHLEAKDKLDKLNDLKKDPQLDEAWIKAYKDNTDAVRKSELRRNICVGAAGVFAIGGIFTFFF